MVKRENKNLMPGAGKNLISREAGLVLSVAQSIVNGRGSADVEQILRQPVNWVKFDALLGYHELSSFAYTCFKGWLPLFDGREVEELKKYHFYVLARLAELEKEFFEIADSFGAEGVDLLPLKGTAFLIDSMYGNLTGLRPMADIDILVRKEQLPHAERLVESLGYRLELGGFKEEYWRRKNYHLMFTKNKNQRLFSTLEVHWLLDYPRKTELLPDLWGRVIKVSARDREVVLLSPEDTLFCLALHLRRFGNVLSLKSACDFACLLVKYQNLDWDYILKQARQGQICVSLYFRLIQVSAFFGLEIAKRIWKELSPSGWRQRLMLNFILKNTFSVPDKDSNAIFLKHHFLVYDNFNEPVGMIIKMPLEQFAKFYRLSPYSKRALWLYRLRFIYWPYHLLALILKAGIRKIIKRPGANLSLSP